MVNDGKAGRHTKGEFSNGRYEVCLSLFSSVQTMASVDIARSFGALLVGGLFASLYASFDGWHRFETDRLHDRLSGFVMVQTYLYYKMYPSDLKQLKTLVRVWFPSVFHPSSTLFRCSPSGAIAQSNPSIDLSSPLGSSTPATPRSYGRRYGAILSITMAMPTISTLFIGAFSLSPITIVKFTKHAPQERCGTCPYFILYSPSSLTRICVV